MIITAEQKGTRQTPTRLRLVAKAIKKLPLETAMLQLRFMDKKAAEVMEKVFKQAVANATKNLGLSLDSLTIKDIIVGEGPQYKRFQPVSRGRAHSILKRTSHVRVILESKETTMNKQTDKPVKGTSTAAKAEASKETAKPAAPRISLQMPKPSVGKTQTTVKAVTVRKTGER